MRSSPRIGQPDLHRLDGVTFKVDRQADLSVNLAFSREVFPELLAIEVILEPATEKVLEQAAAELLVPPVTTHFSRGGIAQHAEPGGGPWCEPQLVELFLPCKLFNGIL